MAEKPKPSTNYAEGRFNILKIKLNNVLEKPDLKTKQNH